MVQPRKTGPYISERLLMGRKESNQTKHNVVQYPLHHVTNAPAKFEVAKSNGLGKDAFTRNVMDRRMDGRTLLASTLFFFIITIIWSSSKSEPADRFIPQVCLQLIFITRPIETSRPSK